VLALLPPTRAVDRVVLNRERNCDTRFGLICGGGNRSVQVNHMPFSIDEILKDIYIDNLCMSDRILYMNRRSLLQLCGSSTLILGSGCVDWFDDSIHICKIAAMTTYETSHQIQLRLSDAGEIVYENRYEIGGSQQGGFEIQGSDIPVRKGQFTLQVKIDEYDWKEWYLPEYTDESLYFELRFLRSAPHVSAGYSPDC